MLDEATAFADPHTEQAVRRALATLAGDRTILVIAHRLETIADADTVVLLENGSIAERGKPAELLARNGKFAEFWQSHRVTFTDGVETLGGVLRRELGPWRRIATAHVTDRTLQGDEPR
ncbi:hypothetical protein [Nocardia gipuzkoensis]